MPKPLRTRSRRACSRLPALVVLLLSPLGASAQTLYWTGVKEYPEFVLRRGGPDGSDVDDFGEDIDGDLGGLAIDAQAGTLYWIENGLTEHRIVRSNLDGGDRK